jgi:hypothetical protein
MIRMQENFINAVNFSLPNVSISFLLISIYCIRPHLNPLPTDRHFLLIWQYLRQQSPLGLLPKKHNNLAVETKMYKYETFISLFTSEYLEAKMKFTQNGIVIYEALRIRVVFLLALCLNESTECHSILPILGEISILVEPSVVKLWVRRTSTAILWRDGSV